MFGGDTQSLTAALAYAKANGGGAVAISSQSGAGTQVIDGADVVAIGGFSGNESEVTAAWLADAVRAGKVRWVLAGDGRRRRRVQRRPHRQPLGHGRRPERPANR